MDPDEGRPRARGRRDAGERARQALRVGGLVADARKQTDEGLSRGAGGDGESRRAQGREVAQEDEVAGGALAEAKPRVDRQTVRRDAGRERPRQGGGELRGDLGERVGVGHVRLHRARVVALHVHQDRRRPRLRHDPRHVRIEAKSGDVVDEVRAGGDRRAGDGGLACVDRKRQRRL